MKRIHQLPPEIVAKIAAGEVIERPAFAVKELIENSIDAKADFVRIELEGAGLKKIIVTDNGEGMSKVDVEECFKPHTTSKISDENDLTHITSLGFRGEALSSIAAISNMTVKTKIEGETAGTVIGIKCGKLENIGSIGTPIGTSVIIDNLFYNVPARKKFLKTEKTEYRHILDVVIHFAISYPKIRFFLSHNNKIIFDLAKTSNLLERIKILLGSSIFQNLVPINFEDSYVKISGFISKPQLTTANQNKSFIFINNRKVVNKLITLSVNESYGNLLEENYYPIFVLFISLPYEAVDVNVHPRKEQVAFINAKLVFDAVNKAVSETLKSNNLTFYNLSFKEKVYSKRKGDMKSHAAKILKEEVIPWDIRDIGKILASSDILQVHNVYLIAQTKQGILIIDQHAAHERILYEQFLDAFKKQKKNKKTYQLSQSVPMELTFQESESLLGNIKTFRQLGFEVENFKDNIFKINSVPELFKDRDCRELVRELLDDILEDRMPREIDKQSIKMIEYLACRSAIKAGDKLTKKECKEILEKLEQTNSQYTCPHGRPVKIEISINELARLFKRV